MDRADIIVAGGGLAGKFATAMLAVGGYRIVCCDPKTGTASATGRMDDNRLTALLRPAREPMQKAGIWPSVESLARPLRTLRILDSGAGEPESFAVHEFDSLEIDQPCFGWVVRNSKLNEVLDEQISELPEVSMMTGVGIAEVVSRSDEIICKLTNGQRLRGRLLIAADGRKSDIRSQLGITATGSAGGRSALSFNIAHSEPHGGITTEIYASGETLTTIPLPNGDDDRQSAVVWVLTHAAAEQARLMDAGELAGLVESRTHDLLGAVKLATKPRRWPVHVQIATRLGAGRVVLIGETAHVASPIGAQGFNMTIADIQALDQAIQATPNDPGSRRVVDRYRRIRCRDMPVRLAAVGALSIAATSEIPIVQHLRRQCLAMVHRRRILRRGLMRAGLGPAGIGRESPNPN